MKAIQLIEVKVACDTHPRYNVMFRGTKWGELYFNLRGYVGTLPMPKSDGTVTSLTIGEASISNYRKEVAKLNSEWRTQ